MQGRGAEVSAGGRLKTRVLLVTEGTYPYVLGGVSTWCDQLIRGLPEYRFDLLALTGPLPSEAVYARPANVTTLRNIPIWTPRPGLRQPRPGDRASFEQGFDLLLSLLDGDVLGFAEGLRQLATLGDHVNLWPLFERRQVWRYLHARLRRSLPYTPSLAEIALCVNWLKSALSPLLYAPPETDLVHAVGGGLSAVPAWLASKLHGAPLILSEHGVYLRERYLGFSSEGDLPALKALRAGFYQTLSRLLYRHADRVLSVSTFNQTWQLELGAAKTRTEVIPNGVEPTGLVNISPKRNGPPTVVWLGRIDPLKDLGTLLSAFAKLRARMPAAQLKLYGPVPAGNEAYFEQLKVQIDDLKLKQSVSFEGEVRPAASALREADTVALSSVSEGFPYTVIEAMMAGKPVVATRVGGVAEALGNTGRLVTAQQADDFAGALFELLSSEALRLELGNRARARALDYFTLDRMLSRYEQVYQTLITPASVSLHDSVVMLNGRPFKPGPQLEIAEDVILLEDDS